ncbi:aminotransferase [Endozoicomonas sp. (ex Bugula neritina AB1)]|nr:aminotransferase [Endozoicomonas sp. (ex Bugula neritina AB1)]
MLPDNWHLGILSPSPWEVIAATLLLTHITILSVTIYLHRFSAHNSLILHPALQHFFRFWIWLTTSINTKEWTSIHRKHHALCETEENPHSPVQKSLSKVLWQGAELYRTEAQNEETLKRYGQRTPNDWIENKLYTPFKHLGVVLMLAINLALFGIIGVSIWAVQMIWIPFFAAGVINGIGHHSGYRNFECPDAARNILPWGILIGGEELHNNHHTYPNSARLSVKKWEIDIGWLWIKAFSMLGLARVKHIQPLVRNDIGKSHIDYDTVMAIINNRFQIMVQYRKQVIIPMVEHEQQKAGEKTRKLFLSAKKLLAREESLLANQHKEEIGLIIDSSHLLNTIYQKKQDLQAIWLQRKNHQDRLDALKEWCQQAEASGIKSLQDFSLALKTYTLPSSA